MAQNDEYDSFRRDRETSARIKRLLNADYQGDRDRRIVEAVERRGINFANINQGLGEKDRIIMEECGYSVLQIAHRKFLPVPECSPHRRNMTLRQEYMAARKRLTNDKGK
ncbi:hypothetical protein HYT23_00635 [Candidatus Pacearchaeota archaeon]|nr:hypothetical protein [Candidatus Pacearchaeota archaeon]